MGKLASVIFGLLAAAALGAPAAVPPVELGDVVVQKIGAERSEEELREGLIFVNADTGELMYTNEENPHGRAVCVCKDFPDWHNLTNTLRVNGHRIELNVNYSLQAEANAVSLRYGTNTLLQILATETGTLATLTAEFEDETHLLLTANAPADAILQTATNLLEAAAWSTVTNAVVVETTDVSTTWRITLLDSPVPEFYRVIGAIDRTPGIYANAPLHATQGLVMGTNTWTELPDTNAFLTAETDAAALAALDTASNALHGEITAHTSATNPHGITAEGLGALTAETDATALAALGVASNALSSAISAHASATTNPHAVTAAQVGALPLTGGTIIGLLSVTGPDYRYGKLSHGLSVTNNGTYSFAGGEKTKTSAQNCFAFGYLSQATAYAAQAFGGRCMAQGNYAQAAGLRAVSTNACAYTWQGVNNSTDYGSHGDGTWNINPVGGADGVFIGQSNLTQIINAAVAAWMAANGY